MSLKVIVVGAGIGGLTSAAALRRAGCDVQVSIFVLRIFSNSKSRAFSLLRRPGDTHPDYHLIIYF